MYLQISIKTNNGPYMAILIGIYVYVQRIIYIRICNSRLW